MLIGLHGRAGSGKDQSFQYIHQWAEERGLPVRRDAFADRLKLSAARALGYQGTLAECVAICNQLKQPGWEVVVREPSGVEHVITGREYQQYYGDEAHRQTFGKDFWIEAVMTSYDPDELLVITDVRYPNEAEAIRDAGGQVWEVLRGGEAIAPEHHASEQPLARHLVDVRILNHRSLAVLRERVLFQVSQGVAHELGCS